MKKLCLTITYLFIILSVLSAQIKKNDFTGKDNRLYISIADEDETTFISIVFKDAKTYTFFSPFGGYLWGTYNYKIEGNTISFEKTTLECPFNIDELNKLFSKNNPNQFVEFVYDSNFHTFSQTGGFRNGKILLYNSKFSTPTPQGTECLIGKTKVIKKSGYLVPVENLRVRKEPSIKSELGLIDYYFELMCLSEQIYEKYDILLKPQENNYTPILLAGMIRSYNAVTVEKQTIDGITAPWYRIGFSDGEVGITRYYWVFGGYIEEVFDANTKNYQDLFFTSAEKKGYLESKALQEERRKVSVEQSQKVFDVADPLHKKGKIFENNDLLNDSPLKIGMTRQDVIALFGPCSGTDQWGRKLDASIMEYNTFALPYGYGYILEFTLKNEKVVKIACYFEK
ncbi:MAG: hypothetical protein K6G52_09110 [Treponemataceae bacterium]|nr:hypothetical protein [Treponemataceae bacterium]